MNKATHLVICLAAVGLAVGFVLAQAQKKPSAKGTQEPSAAAPAVAPLPQISASGGEAGREASPEVRARAEAALAPGYNLENEARALLRQGKPEEAEQKCLGALDFFQGTQRADSPHEIMGDIQLAKGEYNKALESYALARRISANAELPVHTALCYVRLGDLKKAQRACSTRTLLVVAGMEPDQVDDLPGTDNLTSMQASILMALGSREFMSEEPATALTYLETATKLAPSNWRLASLAGDANYRLKRYDKAMPYYRIAIQCQGDKASYRTRMRVEMYDLKKKQK